MNVDRSEPSFGVGASLVGCAVVLLTINALSNWSHVPALSLTVTIAVLGVTTAVARLHYKMTEDEDHFLSFRSAWVVWAVLAFLALFPVLDGLAAATNSALFDAAQGLNRDVPYGYMPWYGTTTFKLAGIAFILGLRIVQRLRDDRRF